eukprot:2121369-Rhodomonas_salina.3
MPAPNIATDASSRSLHSVGSAGVAHHYPDDSSFRMLHGLCARNFLPCVRDQPSLAASACYVHWCGTPPIVRRTCCGKPVTDLGRAATRPRGDALHLKQGANFALCCYCGLSPTLPHENIDSNVFV